ncbi:MAG: hypothetical protein MJZ98_05790, partial [Paludibacteraceae bacterium]|nr:hypothetical protein [Paludibacteraceae bacterium]
GLELLGLQPVNNSNLALSLHPGLRTSALSGRSPDVILSVLAYKKQRHKTKSYGVEEPQVYYVVVAISGDAKVQLIFDMLYLRSLKKLYFCLRKIGGTSTILK